jgi:phosphohistidine swiveling domain-containing protein
MQNINQAIEELISKKWHYIHKRPRSVFYQYVLTMGACLHCNKKIDFPYEIPMAGIDYDLALGQVEWDNLNILVQEQIEKNNNFLVDLIKDSYNLNKNIEDLSIRLEGLDYLKVSKDGLVLYWEEYLSMLYEVGAYVIFPLFAEKYLETKLREEINKKFSLGEADKVFQILTTPIKPGVIQKEEESLLKIAIKNAREEMIDKDVYEHIREFAWIKNNKFDGSFYSRDEVLERVSLLTKDNPEKKLKEYLEKFSESRVQFDLYKEYFVDNKELISIIDTLQEAIYFRSWRTERYYRNAYFLQPFFIETSKRIGLGKVDDIFNLKADEIVDGLKSGLKVDIQTIKNRSEGYVLYSNFDHVYIFSGVEADLIKKSVKLNDAVYDSQIKGMIAYAGKAKGPARIILSTKELDLVQTGDVLVTSSTTPDFVPVLKRVVAIITEEGGVLSHASIISRELHIPCIIGTKNATKALKDGDVVEVDADNGVVRIIK